MYYGVFLAIAAGTFVVALAAVRPAAIARALPWLVLGAVVAAALSLPYAWQYLGAADTVGSRPLDAIREYSARPGSYLVSPPQSWLWGWTADRGSAELRLFPGLIACALAVAGLFGRPRPIVLVYAAVGATGVVMSLGLNAPPYEWLVARLDVLQGLRAPSRFAIVAMSALAVLAALGVQVIAATMTTRPSANRLSRKGLVAAVRLDAAGRRVPQYGDAAGRRAPDAHRRPGRLPRSSCARARASCWSCRSRDLMRFPARSLCTPSGRSARGPGGLNGYSGYYPPSYIQTVARLESFPDQASIALLQRLGVRYIIVHKTRHRRARRTRRCCCA